MNKKVKQKTTSIIVITFLMTVILVPLNTTDASAETILIDDDFSTDLDDWGYSSFCNSCIAEPNPTDNYSLTLDNSAGQSLPSALISGDGYAITSGMVKSVTISNDTTQIVLSFDGMAQGSLTSHSYIPNLLLSIFTSNGTSLYGEYVIGPPDNTFSVSPTDWQSFEIDITDYVENEDSITVFLGLADSWSVDYEQSVWIDNVQLISYSSTTPDIPTSLTATFGDTQVSLSWAAPSDDGGDDITDYLVEYSDDDTTWNTFVDGINTETNGTVTDLTNNQEYSFRVSAVNSIGTGDPSDIVVATPETQYCGQLESYYDNIIIGTNSTEILIGTSQNDLILGYDGDDSIQGGAGDDCIYAGDGNDVIVANAGNDTIYGESGNDSLFGNKGTDMIYGGDGNDIIWGQSGIDSIDAGDGSDICMDIVNDTVLSCEITS